MNEKALISLNILLAALLFTSSAFGLMDAFDDLANQPSNDVVDGSPSPFEHQFVDLDISDVNEQQLANFYLALADVADSESKLTKLNQCYSDTNKNLDEAWSKEIGKERPSFDSLRATMSPWGVSWRNLNEQREAVLQYIDYLKENQEELGPMAQRTFTLLLADIIYQTKIQWEKKQGDNSWNEEFDGAPDWSNPLVFRRAYTRLVFFIRYRDEILLSNAHSLAKETAVAHELTVAPEKSSLWASGEGQSQKILALAATRPELSVDAKKLQHKYELVKKCRQQLALLLSIPTSEVVPGRELVSRLRKRFVYFLSRGDGQAVKKLQKAANDFVEAGKDALKEELSFLRRVRQMAPNEANQGEHSGADVKVEKITGDELMNRVRHEILEADLDVRADLFDFEIIKGISISAKYKYELEPSYRDGWHTRIDRYTVNGNVKVGDILEGLRGDLPVYLNLTPKSEIVFARQYKSKWESAKKMPKIPWVLPLTADEAKEMKTGDFVSMPVELRAATGINTPSSLSAAFWSGAGSFSFSAGLSYVVVGTSRFNVMRMEGDKVRLRITAMRDKTKQASLTGKIGYDFQEIIPWEFIGIKLLDHIAGELIGEKILQYNLSKFENSLFTWDFVFDLSDEKAARAYDAILKASWKLKTLKASLPLTSIEKAQEIFLSDIRPAESLAQQELHKPENERVLQRIFKGGSDSIGKRRHFKFGLEGFNFSHNTFTTENKVVAYDEYEKAQRFLLPMHSTRFDWRLLYGRNKERTERTAYSVIPTDALWQPTGGMATVLGLTYRDRKVSKGEIEDVVEQVEAAIGKENLKRLCDPQELLKVRKSLNLSLTVTMSEELLTEALNTSVTEGQLWQAIASTVEVHPIPMNLLVDDEYGLDYKPDGYSSMDERSKAAIKTIIRATESEHPTANSSKAIDWDHFEKIMRSLRKIVRTSNTKAKADEFIDLSKDLWLKTALCRLLIELTSHKSNEDSFFIHLVVEGKGLQTVDNAIGSDSLAELYQLVQDISFNVNDNSYDMR